MNLPDKINTIEGINEVTTTVNKSNFIAQVYPIFSESDVKEYLSNSKKKHFNASHHCYAFKLASGSFRYSDAGEPNGTAGIRILNAIEHFKLSNQLIIVSRVFGGIKLGVGPLGKAYYNSAYKVLNDSKVFTKYLFRKATIFATFDQISSIHRILSNHNSIVEETEYQESIELSCLIKSDEIDIISNKISEFGKSEVNVIILDEIVYK